MVDVRTIGAVGVLELDTVVDVVRVTEAALDRGVWVRPFRNLVYTMPPYVSTPEEIRTITDAMSAPWRRCTDERASRTGSRAQAAERADAGLTRRLVASGTRRSRRIDLAGNDYLGLSRDPTGGRGRRQGRRGVRRRGRRVAPGHRHAVDPRQLERALADFTGFPAALVFSTGYHANLSAVVRAGRRDTLIVSDAHVHASMIDACRLSRGTGRGRPAQRRRRRRCGAGDRTQARALVLVESIYSRPRRRGAAAARAAAAGPRRPAGRRRGARPRRLRAPADAACCTRPVWPGVRTSWRP